MSDVGKRLAMYRKAWRMEIAESRLYRTLAEREPQEERKAVLARMAEMEERHAERWSALLRELGEEPGDYRESLRDRVRRWMILRGENDVVLRRLESTEAGADALYAELSSTAQSEEEQAILHQVQTEERAHGRALVDLAPSGQPPASRRLGEILGRERWHVRGAGWLGQAIYGLNDGLGAAFGVVSGVAGATGENERFVLLSGLATALASALSMGSGAYLSEKSQREVYEAEIGREREEIKRHPAEEVEEVALFYELKGFSPEDARRMASKLGEQPEQLLKILAHEELGLSEASFPNPWRSSASAAISTGIGAIVPVLPYFLLHGPAALLTSFVISTAAHFGVGAAKVVVTGRSWIRSGLEMMVIGLGEATITYLIGRLISPLLG
jgi:VIT1/CCC1 family predicted Fe2+/Mn2+ transporter/rubrerythrin